MGLAPASEFPFVGEGGVRAVESADALTAWAKATASHHGYNPHALPALHYAQPTPPPGYAAPFAYGLYGAADPGQGARLRRGAPMMRGLGRTLVMGIGGVGLVLIAAKALQGSGRKKVSPAVLVGLGVGAWLWSRRRQPAGAMGG